jgi:hypothetical protein
MQRIVWALACASLLSAPAALAQEGLGWVFEFDLEFGGDAVATTNFTDGSSQDTHAGQGLSVAAGAHYRAAGSSWDTRATLGYKYVSSQASDADIYMRRVPMELIVDYMYENGAWLGLGVSRHTGIQYNGGGVNPNVAFEDATGPVIEVGWQWIGLSYTFMDYTATGGGTVNADNVGLKVIGRF